MRPCVPCVNLLLLPIVLQCHQSFTGARTVQRDAFFVSLCPLRQFVNVFPLLFLGGAGTLLRDIFMSPAQRDTLTGHFLRPCVPCVILLIVLQCRPLFLKGRKDVWILLRDIFYESRLTGHSSGTLFRVPMSLASFCYLFCNVGNFSLRDARTKGLDCGTFFKRPAQRDTLTGHLSAYRCPVLTNRLPEFGVQHEGTGAGSGN